MNLSEVDTDDEKNQEAMKKSRHARCMKILSSSDLEQEIPSNRKQKFTLITNLENEQPKNISNTSGKITRHVNYASTSKKNNF